MRQTLGHTCSIMDRVSTEQVKTHIQRLGRGLVDGAHLYTIMSPTPDRPHDSMHLQWIAIKNTLDGIVNRRDFAFLRCCMECTIDGKRAWVRASNSVDLDSVPDLRQVAGLIRAYMFDMGHVFIESDRPGYVVMTCVADMDVKTPSGMEWAKDHGTKAWCRNLADVDRCLREDRLSRTPFLREEEFVPIESRRYCYLCNRKFSPLRRRSNCSKCGQVFCKKCNRSWHVVVQGIATKVKACNACCTEMLWTSQSVRTPLVHKSSQELPIYNDTDTEEALGSNKSSEDLSDYAESDDEFDDVQRLVMELDIDDIPLATDTLRSKTSARWSID
ncbi:hypothetical protein AC1031_011755 [Aphanomyces cochlioides]|nr:hypothetical protein AC1031_011755 [Aphanomyces cochlioides]